MPGTAASASCAGQLGLDVAVELGEALVAGQLGSGRPEDAAEAVAIAHRSCAPRRPAAGAASAWRRGASCTPRRGWSRAAPRARRSGTSLSVIATSTSRWCGVSSSLDRRPQRSEQLAPSRRPRRVPPSGRRSAPSVAVERTWRSCQSRRRVLDAGLEQGELVGPGGEAAGAAEVVELREHGHERVVGALVGQVVGVGGGSTPARTSKRAARRSSACSSRDRLVALAARRAQPGQPFGVTRCRA